MGGGGGAIMGSETRGGGGTGERGGRTDCWTEEKQTWERGRDVCEWKREMNYRDTKVLM